MTIVVNVILIICFLFLSVGGLLTGLRAFQYWRGEAHNARKLALLLLARAMLDFLSVGIMVGLWFSNVAGEVSILSAGLVFVGVYTVILRLFEVKLATGKFQLL